MFSYLSIRRPPLGSLLAAAAFCLATLPASADMPAGWLGSNITSAYTLRHLEVDLSVAALAVNSDIDVFNVRDDLIAGNARLAEDSGDLAGVRAEVQFGLGSMFTLFYRHHQHDLTVKMAPQSRVDVEDIDTELRTTAKAYGIKWNFYEAGRSSSSRSPWQAASLEVSRLESESDPFQSTIKRVRVSASTQAFFVPPQLFQVDSLQDEGWIARLIFSFPIGSTLAASTWVGYGTMEAHSGTSSEVDVGFIREAAKQSFESRETQYIAGASLNWQLTERLPVQLNYEYLRITDRELHSEVNSSNVILPSFLQASNISYANDNHTLSGSISYWLTPRLNLGLQAKVFSNQFVGTMPHYSNPLSGRFADSPYGYAALQLGYRL